MDAGQIIFTLLAILVITLVGMLVIALRAKHTVFLNNKDVLNCVGIFLGPLITLMILVSVFDDKPSDLTIISAFVVPFIWFSYQCFKISIQCNGLFMGVIIGFGKVILSILMILFVWGLLSKVFRGDHKNSGTLILMMLFLGVFAWVLDKLINGDEVKANKLVDHKVA
jgi:hypothetical protein